MNDILQKMLALTEVDFELVQTREQLAKYPAMLSAMQAAEAEPARRIEQANKDLEAAKTARRAAEKEIEAQRERIKRLERQQQEVKTNKEYQAMLHEIGLVREQIDAQETIGLEKLEAEDIAAQAKRAAEAKMAELKKANDAERARIDEQIKEKKQKLARLTKERATRLAILPEDYHESYEVMNKRFPGTACVPIEAEICGGCHWQQISQTQYLVRKGDELVRCDHCRRFLYVK